VVVSDSPVPVAKIDSACISSNLLKHMYSKQLILKKGFVPTELEVSTAAHGESK
jgi:hypothetical protein